MPTSNALFGNAATRNQSKNLVEFKAGKMALKGKMVHPDKRKGLVYVYQSDDSLMHFCWKDRTSGTVEDDLIIFPDDCEFKKVDQCTTGRVYVLKFKSSSRKFFFWVQEPKTEKDDDNCKKINEMLNNPPAAGSSRSGGTTPDGDLQSLLGSMSQQQLMQLFGTLGSGSSNVNQLSGLSNLLGTMSGRGHNARTTTPNNTTASSLPTTEPTTRVSSVTSARPHVPNPIQLSDLQNLLSYITPSPTGQTGTAAAAAAAPQTNVDLAAALNTESIAGVLADPSLVRELTPHLPNVGGTETTQEQLRSTLTSPQFQQAVSMFSAALQSGQLGPVIQQFQVGDTAVNAANQGNMEEFVKALENTNINKETEEEEVKQPEKKKKTDDDKKVDDKKDDDKDGDDKMTLG